MKVEWGWETKAQLSSSIQASLVCLGEFIYINVSFVHYLYKALVSNLLRIVKVQIINKRFQYGKIIVQQL